MCDFGDLGSLVSSATDVAQEAAPVALPLAGAAIGGIADGGKGALEGGLAGLAAGQLVGTGPLSLFGSGDQSLLGSIVGGFGGTTGATGATAGAAGAAAPSAVPGAAPSIPAAVGAAGGGGTGAGLGAGGATFSPDVAGSSPQGFDATALSNFNAENTVNPAASATTQNVLAAPDATAAAGGTAKTADKGWMDIAKQFAGPAVGIAGLGYEAIKGTPAIPNQAQITSAADQQAALAAKNQTSAQPLIDSLSTGQLPAGAQASVDQSVKSNQAQIRSTFASMGLGGSSMETEALNQAESQGQQQKFTIAQQMAQTGISLAGLGTSETGLSTQLYQQLANAELTNDTNMQNAILAFVQAIAGSGGGINLKV